MLNHLDGGWTFLDTCSPGNIHTVLGQHLDSWLAREIASYECDALVGCRRPNLDIDIEAAPVALTGNVDTFGYRLLVANQI